METKLAHEGNQRRIKNQEAWTNGMYRKNDNLSKKMKKV
jgi:hypothetical protein